MKFPHPITILAMLLAGSTVQAAIPEGMELVWADEFDYEGAPDPAKWSHELGGGGWGNNEAQFYTAELENSRVEDDRLIIEVHQNEGGRTPYYTSARLVTRDKAEWKYGRFEARAKMPNETGTWAAIWMLAAEQVYGTAYWPDNGEIDIVEHVGYEEDPRYQEAIGSTEVQNIHGTLHNLKYNGWTSGGLGSKLRIPDATSEWHVYALNWLEDGIEIEVDGTVYFSLPYLNAFPRQIPNDEPWQYWPWDQPFFLILNVAVGGNWGGVFNSNYFPNDSIYGTDGINHEGTWPQRMEVDYIRVYSYPQGGSWKGLPTDPEGNADSGSWMGRINVSTAPWLYSWDMDKFFRPESALEEEFHTGSQWVYFPKY